MIRRAWFAGIAWVALLASASVCAAADEIGNRGGRGSIGGSIGGSLFTADADYSAGASPRFWFAGQFRYVFSPRLRAQFSPGFTWAGYSKDEPLPLTDPRFPEDKTKEHVLSLLMPSVVQLQYTVPRGLWLYHAGAGGGLYRVWVENHRRVLKDPTTYDLHRGLYPGVSGEVGAALFLKDRPNLALEWAAGGDWIFAERDEQFPGGFNSFLLMTHVRFGASYYFDLMRPAAKPALPLGQPGR
jgi:hypothetical protein